MSGVKQSRQTSSVFFLLGVFPNISNDDLGVVSANDPLNKGGILGPDDLGPGEAFFLHLFRLMTWESCFFEQKLFRELGKFFLQNLRENSEYLTHFFFACQTPVSVTM